MEKINAIKEKIELKDLEIQGNTCAHMSGEFCRYDCCEDCHNHTDSFMSDRL